MANRACGARDSLQLREDRHRHTTVTPFFACRSEVVHGACQPLLLRKHRVRHIFPFVFTPPDWRCRPLPISRRRYLLGLRNTACGAGAYRARKRCRRVAFGYLLGANRAICERNEAAACQ